MSVSQDSLVDLRCYSTLSISLPVNCIVTYFVPISPPRLFAMGKKRVAVIGAGPCGLPALKEMLDAGHDAVLFDRSGSLGGVFASTAAYPDLHLTISNWAMAFSDFPDPTRLRYSSAGEYLEYLQSYARHFDLERHMQFHSAVRSAELDEDGRWQLVVEQGQQSAGSPTTMLRMQVDALVVATGAHHVPNSPPPELTGFQGQVLHSSEYGADFKREVAIKKLRVLVVGGGESAADIAAELGDLAPAQHTAVWLRRPHCFGPRYLNHRDEMAQVQINKQRDFPANSFLEAATTNRMSAAQNVYLYGLWRRILWRMPILNASLNSMCLDSTRPAFFLNDQATFVTKNQRMCEALQNGKIDVLVSPTLSVRDDGRTCEFQTLGFSTDKARSDRHQAREFDAVVLCTGYRTEFPWLKVDPAKYRGFRTDNARSWFLHCFPPGDVARDGRLSFIGYARPHQGGIPPMAEMQARLVALVLRGDRKLPRNLAALAVADETAERNYYYISPDLHTLVDYAAFLENVARRVGCEPRLPLFCIALFNLHMLALLWGVLGSVRPGHALAPSSLWTPGLVMAATFAGFVTYRDGLLIKWWVYPQWPVWYRQRGPGAKPAALQSILARVPLWKSTAITPGFLLLLVWSIPTFYLQRLLSVPLFVLHAVLGALGVRFREAWGGLLRPKMVVLHSGIWRIWDLFLP